MKHRVQVALGAQSRWLEIEADSIEAAHVQAARSGARVLRVVPAGEAAAPTRVHFAPGVFLQESVTLLRAGLNIVEVTETLHRKEADPGFREVLARLLVKLRQGASFSVAMAAESPLFPPVLVAGVAASETAGGLAETLERYLEYDGRIDQIRRKVFASAIYPLLLLLVGGGVILFLVGYVVPKFSTILGDSGRPVGMGTRALLWCGATLQTHPLVVGVLLAGVAAGLAWMVTHPSGRASLLRAASHVPVLAGILVNLGLSRFYRTLALLLQSGIPLVPALEMVRGVLGPVQADEVGQALQRLRSGQMLSESLAGTSMVPPIAESLLRVGERSGALAAMSDKLANFLDLELDRRVETFSRLFEPLLMTGIGLVIGAIVVLMYAPIFDLVGSVG
ncbi:MAG TPA: type II secretion system F family protein [Stenotrophomonas sp.]